jgi:rhomboid protease GluP
VRLRRKGSLIWIIKNGFVFSITLVSLKLFPEQAGFIGGGFWFVLIFLPLSGIKIVNRLQLRQLFKAARVMCLVLWVLHPDQSLKLNIIILNAKLLGKQGKREQAINYLEKYKQTHKLLHALTTIYSLILSQKWQELVVWFKGIQMNTVLLSFYTRALGEIGAVSELIRIPVVYRSLFEKENYFIKNTIRLHVFAFSGFYEEVELLLNGALSGLCKAQKIYWRAVALQARGEKKLARSLFEPLKEHKNFLIKDAVLHRLQLPQHELIQKKDPAVMELLEKTKDDFLKEERFSLFKKVRRRRAVVTLSIIGINIIIFMGEELWGGSKNEMTLYEMGALYTLGFVFSDVWRIITAQFLHYGVLHLVMNMLGLYILGPYVELFLGHIRYALVYILSGVGAFACYLLVAGLYGTYDFLVGASACIMGVIGALFAILMNGFFRYKIKIVKSQLLILGFFIGMQSLFDITTPEVSFLGHFFGLVFGFLITWILMLMSHREVQKQTVKKLSHKTHKKTR